MHKDAALCQSAVRDGDLRQMFTDQVMLHRKALVYSIAVFAHLQGWILVHLLPR